MSLLLFGFLSIYRHVQKVVGTSLLKHNKKKVKSPPPEKYNKKPKPCFSPSVIPDIPCQTVTLAPIRIYDCDRYSSVPPFFHFSAIFTPLVIGEARNNQLAAL